MSKQKPTPRSVVPVEQTTQTLLADLRTLIDGTRGQVAQVVNAGLTLMYWAVGDRIRREILGEKRAEYGEQIVATVSRQLTDEYGRGFSRPNLFRMVRFAEAFPDQPIVSTLSRQLGWSHFQEIIGFDNSLKRDFYAEICRMERWSVRTLRERIGGQLFERTAIARRPDEQIREEFGKEILRTVSEKLRPTMEEPFEQRLFPSIVATVSQQLGMSNCSVNSSLHPRQDGPNERRV